MPIYVYKCTSCGEKREIFMVRVPKEVPQRGPISGCPSCHGGHLKLVVGEGVIARYGRQWVTRNLFDDGTLEQDARRSVGDLNMVSEMNLKRKYAATTAIDVS